jgi:hypothetical protein
MSHVSLDQLLCKEEIPAQTKVAKVTESVKTLESLHSQQLSTFAEEKTNLPELRAKLKAMKQELAIAERDYTSPHILAQVNDIQTLMRHSRLETQIQELETKIASFVGVKKENNPKSPKIRYFNPNNILTVKLNDLKFNDEFFCSLNEVLDRRKELEDDINSLFISVDEDNMVISGELDVLALLSLDFKEYDVFQRKSTDTTKIDSLQIGEVLGKAMYVNTDKLKFLIDKSKSKK